MEADGRVAVQRAEQQSARVRRVGGVGDVTEDGFVRGDGLGLDVSGVGVRVGRDRAQGTRAARAVVCRQAP